MPISWRYFLNADPIGLAGGSNWYQYANGSPIMKASQHALSSSHAP